MPLNLERTLISDANRADPRPGLANFLAFGHKHFARVVLFTADRTANCFACNVF